MENLVNAKIPKGKRKPEGFKATMGRKTKKALVDTNKKLRELYDQDGITPWRASIMCDCSYEYAVQKFREFGQQLIDAEDESWLDRNEKVRNRALEGLSIKIKDCEKDIEFINKEIEEYKRFQVKDTDEAIQQLNNSPLHKIIGKMDRETFIEFVHVLSHHIETHRSYGSLISNFTTRLLAQKVFYAELQQQYDSIEILPPVQVLIEAEIERKLAKKVEIYQPALPEAQKK